MIKSCFGTTPDYRRLEDVVRGRVPDRVPLYEYFSDTNVQLAALGNCDLKPPCDLGENPDIANHILAQYYLGYDYLVAPVALGFTRAAGHHSKDSAGNDRYFQDDAHAIIKNRKDFDSYPWPTPEAVDYSMLEYLSKHMPDGMKLVINLGGGLLEWAVWLVGVEDFCLMVYDDPQLVRELLRKISDQQVAAALAAVNCPDAIFITLGDDLGFKTQTFLPPKDLRELIFPGLKRVVDAVHANDKPFMLHSCGNLSLVMDDLIDYVGIDAKHSFEDVIMPVTEVKRLWGDRVSLMGGIDMDMLVRASEPTLRAYVRNTVEICSKGGRFALGSGNSIANYIPPKSLRAMLDEAIKCQTS